MRIKKNKVYIVLTISFWLIASVGFVGGALLLKSVDSNWFGWYGEMPSIDKLQNPNNELASIIYTADGQVLGKYFRENRTNASFKDLSPHLISALYATEDIRFDHHAGIDLKGLASIAYYLAQGKRRGASTITQQLAKNLLNTRIDTTLKGDFHDMSPKLGLVADKFKEWILATKLEQIYTKEEIMTLYFNTVDYGSNSSGINTASQTFFNKKPRDLNVEEAAVLVGLLKGTTKYSPVSNPIQSKNRRNQVMENMAKYNFISKELKDSLVKEPLKLVFEVERVYQGDAPYFRAQLQKFLSSWCRKNNFDMYGDGLKVYTTLDSRLQKYAEKAVNEHMAYQQDIFVKHWNGTDKYHPWGERDGIIRRAIKNSPSYKRFLLHYEGNEDSAQAAMTVPRKMKLFSYEGDIDTTLSPVDSIIYMKYFLHAGMVSIHPQTGHIKAWVGGVDFEHFQYDHVEQGRRQPGSAFKPIIYSAWLNKGYTPCYRVLDAPVTIFEKMGNGETRKWTPDNADGKWSDKEITLREGLAKSLNSISAYLIQQMGPEVVVENARKLGITAPLEPVYSLALGSKEVNPKELVSAYGTFVNLGKRVEPIFVTRIEDKYGNIIQSFVPKTFEVFSPEVSFMMLYLMRGSTEISGATSRRLWRMLDQNNEIAAKTGTTNDHADGWFIGLTKDLCTGIWVGGDERTVHFRTIEYGQGARMALPIWQKYMQEVYEDKTLGVSKGPFKRPANFDYAQLECADENVLKEDTSDIEDGDVLEDQKMLEDPEFTPDF